MYRIRLKFSNWFLNRNKVAYQERLLSFPDQSTFLKKTLSIAVKTFLLTIFSLIVLIPFYFMINIALQSKEQVSGNKSVIVNTTLNWSNFTEAFTKGYWKALINTTTVTVISTVARVFFSATIGYAFSLKNWKYKNGMWYFFLALMLLPEIALFVGQYQIVVKLKMKQAYWGLVMAMFLPYVTSTFSAFMYKNAFSSISDRTKEAAMIDGVGSISFLYKLGMPMVKSTTFTVVILSALGSWNAFSWPIIVTTGSSKKFFLLSTWLFNIGVEDVGDSPVVFTNIKMAGAILTLLPMFFAYFIFRRKIMQSISSSSGVKG